MITLPIGFYASVAAGTGGTGGYDPNAQAYINAVLAAGGTLNTTTQDAVNMLFLGLKATTIYNKLWSMFPIVGGTEAAHAINALNPGTRDLTFVGGWTHGPTGAEGNNTNTAARTGYIPQNNYGLSGTSWGWYNNKSVTLVGERYIGALNNIGPQKWMSVQLSSGRTDWGADSVLTLDLSGGQTGMYILSGGFPASNNLSATKNDNYFGSGTYNTSATYADQPYELYMGALNLDNSVYGSTDQRFAFYFIGTTLTQNEQETLSYIINNFQAMIGRNSYESPYVDFVNQVNTVGGSLTTTEKLALNRLIIDLKIKGNWTSFSNIYPFVGNQEETCALDLKNPSASANTITFYGTWSFTSYGIQPAISSSWANTKWPATSFSNNRFYYRYVNGIGAESCAYDGAGQSGGSPYVALGRCTQLEFFDGGVAVSLGGAAGSGYAQATNRKGATTTELWRELTAGGGTPWSILGTSSAFEGTLPTSGYAIGKMNTLNAYYNMDRSGFYAFGSSIATTQKVEDFHTAVKTFCTTLGRAY